MVGGKMYITYDENTKYSTGCSSSLPIEPYIEVDNIEEKFYVLFSCYKVDVENNKVIFDESKHKERIEEKQNRLNEYQVLAQENSQLQIDMIKLKMYLEFPVFYNYDANEYWNERLKKKFASKEQINELIELGIIE